LDFGSRKMAGAFPSGNACSMSSMKPLHAVVFENLVFFPATAG
jgi:hypothetical protein